jgi:hypothetical protein
MFVGKTSATQPGCSLAARRQGRSCVFTDSPQSTSLSSLLPMSGLQSMVTDAVMLAIPWRSMASGKHESGCLFPQPRMHTLGVRFGEAKEKLDITPNPILELHPTARWPA